MPGRGELLHRPFPLSRGLVRVLRPVVQILRSTVLHPGHQPASCHAVAGQLVGDQGIVNLFGLTAERSSGAWLRRGSRVLSGVVQAAVAIPVTSFHMVKRAAIWRR